MAPILLAADAVCPGARTDILRMLAKPCVLCERRKRHLLIDNLSVDVQIAHPAAEWSDTTNGWRCGNRLPVEG